MTPHFFAGIFLLQAFFYGLRELLLEDRVLLLDPPIRNLRQLLLSEEFIKDLVFLLIGGKERQEILDPSLLEDAREVVDRLFGEVRAEDDRDHISGHIY